MLLGRGSGLLKIAQGSAEMIEIDQRRGEDAAAIGLFHTMQTRTSRAMRGQMGVKLPDSR